MAASKTSKRKPVGDYPVGYAKAPTWGQFKPGQSGNSGGRPKGRPSSDELLLEEIARLVKVKVGEDLVTMDKERAMYRKLIDMTLTGNIAAARLVVLKLERARAGSELGSEPEPPLSPEELAVLKMMTKPSGGTQ